jgi:hypothetical protein
MSYDSVQSMSNSLEGLAVVSCMTRLQRDRYAGDVGALAGSA